MAAYSNERVAAIVISVLYRMLTINSILAHIGCDLLWKMFKEGKTLYRGAYVNLETLKVTAIPV